MVVASQVVDQGVAASIAASSTLGRQEIPTASLAVTADAVLPDHLVYRLGEKEAAALHESAKNCSISPFDELERFLRYAKLHFGDLPAGLMERLIDFRADGNADGMLFVTGFHPELNLPPTPSQTSAGVRKDTIESELYIALTGQLLGEMVGYAQEKNGAFWQSLNPSPGHETRQTSESSTTALEFHTEVMFHPHMPRWILLYGLRQDPERNARTVVSCVRRFYSKLPRRLQDVLFRQEFKTGIDPSFGNVRELKATGPVMSVFYGDREDPYFRYDLDLMLGLTSEANRALAELREHIAANRVEITIVPGSLCIIDNYRTVHARTPFRAHYDGRDRWIERVSVVSDLVPSLLDRARGSRIINTDFSHWLQ